VDSSLPSRREKELVVDPSHHAMGNTALENQKRSEVSNSKLYMIR